MPSNSMSHIMADLFTSNSSSSFTCPFIRLHPHASFKYITHFIPSPQTSRHFHFQRTFPSLPHQHSKSTPVNSLAFGLATGDHSRVEYEEEKAGNFMQPAIGGGDEENEERQSISIAETSLALATHDYKEGSAFTGVNASKAPILAAEMSLDKISRIGHAHGDDIDTNPSASSEIIQVQKERVMKKKAQQLTYLFAALASSVGITSLAGASVYCRFAWQMQGGEVPWAEMCGTFSLALGAAVGMEYWARWAHRALWHASLWSMHESHHQPRDGPFELNDVFAIINAVPAIALMAFGFLNKGLVAGLCFGAGLGITVFGIAYMFVHDGLVHRRFPVGPIADVPYFQKVAAAHQLHHADKFNGVPYGLFLGPMELEEVGGRTELEKVLQKRKRENKNPIIS